MALIWKDKINGVDKIKADDINAMARAIIDLENNAEMSGDGGGAFKRIGFTEDCDYVATSSDGVTAFVNALADAKDGDIIMVMPGTYTSTTNLSITKDITFIGIDRPRIKCNVYTSGGGSFSYENWQWEYIYEPKHSKWYGFVFEKDFSIGGAANPDGECYHGYTTVVDCEFLNYAYIYGGNCFRCIFDNQLYSGHYYGDGNNYTDCVFNTNSANFESGYDKFIRCDFYPQKLNMGYLSTGWSPTEPTLQGCKIYAPNKSLTVSDPHSNEIDLNDTIIFAENITDDGWSGVINGFYVSKRE